MSQTQTNETDPDPRTLFRRRADRFAAVLAGVGDSWDAPTPCPDWTVRQLVDHVIGTERDFLERHDLGVAEPEGDDPAARFGDHLAAVNRRLDEPGVAERRFDGYFGPTTIGDTLADFYGWDLAVHAWDAARGSGQRLDWDDAEVARLGRAADGWGEALHSEGVCAEPLEVPDDASAQDRLLARLGRDPHWHG